MPSGLPVMLPPRIPFEISPDRHRLLREIQQFIAAIHYDIDPDMFDIEPAHVSWLEQLLEPEVEWLTVALSRDELSVLETIVTAAWEYAVRSSTTETISAADDDFQGLHNWILEQYKRFTVTLH